MGEFLILHALLETAGFLPEKPFPRWEVGTLKKRVLKDSLDAAESLDHICSVVVQVP